MICCEHFVDVGRKQLTNRKGKERFAVTQALEEVQKALGSDPQSGSFIVPFTIFYVDLFYWIEGQILEEFRSPFLELIQDFTRRNLPLEVFIRVVDEKPELGWQITQILQDRWA